MEADKQEDLLAQIANIGCWENASNAFVRVQCLAAPLGQANLLLKVKVEKVTDSRADASVTRN